MFFVAFLAIWTLLHVYLYRRAASVPAVARIPWWARVIVVFLLALGYFVARILGAAGLRRLALVLEYITANWIGVAFLVFVSLLALDIVTGFGALWPAKAPRLRAIALVVGLGLSAIALVQGMRAPVVRHFDVAMPNLPTSLDGTRVVFLSDTHLGTMLGESWLDARVAQVNALRPDLILLGGDIIEADDESEAGLLPAMRRLHAPLGVWAVTGNHELHFGQLERNGRVLEMAGARVLRDESFELRPGLMLAGVDDLTSRRRFGDPAVYVDRAFASVPPRTAAILLSHTPWQTERAAYHGAGLMLCGHTHGGQIWPFEYFGRVTYPIFAGRYDVNGMTVIVSRGAGTWGPRMRLWYPSEIVDVTLRSPAVVAGAQ